MTDSRLFELIAQLWCKPNTEHIVMEPELAKEFQKLIVAETRRAREVAIKESADIARHHDCMHCGHVACQEECLEKEILSLLTPKESEVREHDFFGTEHDSLCPKDKAKKCPACAKESEEGK
jgi:hypothetical protein